MAHPKFTQLQRQLSHTFRVPVRQHHVTVYPGNGRWLLRMVVVRRTGITPGWHVNYHPTTHALLFYPPQVTPPSVRYHSPTIKTRSKNNLAFFSRKITRTVVRKCQHDDTPLRLRFVGLPRIKQKGIISWSLSNTQVTDITTITK